jgi:glycosyltransferase involved in cell wall biosynthesis
MENTARPIQRNIVKMPEISIILPFYNADKTLERALISISNQSFKNFECILINNNSTKKSINIASKYCDDDPRFLMVNEEKQGVVHAFNRGLSIAKGNYIARMDADDWSFPDRLMKQFTFLENHKAYGVVAGLAEYIPHKSDTGGFERYVNWSNNIMDFKDILLKQFIESPIINPTVMWKKEVSDRYGSYENGHFPEDYELWLKWLEKGVKFHKLPDRVLNWYDSESRLTRTDGSYSDEAFFKIKTKYLAIWLKNHNPLHPTVVIWGASKISRNRAKLLGNHGIRINGYIDISKKRQLNKQVIYYKDIASPKDIFILVYLKEETMRTNTRFFLEEKGFHEGKNYLLVS